MEEEKEICDYCFNDIDKDKVVLDKHDNSICQDCIDAHYEKCDNCGEYVRANETVSLGYQGNGYTYCQDCVDECCSCCDDCGDYYESDDMIYIKESDKCVCTNCLNDNYHCCDHCGRWTQNDIQLYNSCYYVCPDCADNCYYYCQNCGVVCDSDDIRSGRDGDYYCPDCYDNI